MFVWETGGRRTEARRNFHVRLAGNAQVIQLLYLVLYRFYTTAGHRHHRQDEKKIIFFERQTGKISLSNLLFIYGYMASISINIINNHQTVNW